MSVPIIEKKLTDEQIIKLFAHYKPKPGLIGVVPQPITKVYGDSVIQKTETEIQKENFQNNLKPALVVAVGDGCESTKVGERVIVSLNSVPELILGNTTYPEYQIRFYHNIYVVTAVTA